MPRADKLSHAVPIPVLSVVVIYHFRANKQRLSSSPYIGDMLKMADNARKKGWDADIEAEILQGTSK